MVWNWKAVIVAVDPLCPSAVPVACEARSLVPCKIVSRTFAMVQTFPLAAEAQQPVAAVAGLAAVLRRVQPHLVAAAVAEFAAENRQGSCYDENNKEFHQHAFLY